MATTNRPNGLIDTDILIDHTRGLAQATAFLTARSAVDDVLTSIVSGMELVQGCHNTASLTTVRRLLTQLTVLPIDVPISELAFQLMDTYYLSHRLLIPDALIAATALHHGLTLYTKNTRHFQMIPDLVLVRPY